MGLPSSIESYIHFKDHKMQELKENHTDTGVLCGIANRSRNSMKHHFMDHNQNSTMDHQHQK